MFQFPKNMWRYYICIYSTGACLDIMQMRVTPINLKEKLKSFIKSCFFSPNQHFSCPCMARGGTLLLCGSVGSIISPGFHISWAFALVLIAKNKFILDLIEETERGIGIFSIFINLTANLYEAFEKKCLSMAEIAKSFLETSLSWCSILKFIASSS